MRVLSPLCTRLISEPRIAEQAEYWRTRSEPESTWVEYGNDVEGSGFCKAGKGARDPLGRTDWNLQVLPLQHLNQSQHKPARATRRAIDISTCKCSAMMCRAPKHCKPPGNCILHLVCRHHCRHSFHDEGSRNDKHC